MRFEKSADAPALSETTITIPLYVVLNVEYFRDSNPLRSDFFIKTGECIAIEGIGIDNKLFPQRIGRDASSLREENRLENGSLISKENEVVSRLNNPAEHHKSYTNNLKMELL